jgi:hypothetical protein
MGSGSGADARPAGAPTAVMVLAAGSNACPGERSTSCTWAAPRQRRVRQLWACAEARLGTVNLAGWPRLRGRARLINRVG